MAPLHKLLDFNSLDKIRDTSAFHRAVTVIIQKGNLISKASVELALYLIFSREGDDLLCMSLLTEFGLRMLDNKYFDMLRDFVEDYFANKRPSAREVTHVVGLIRKIAQCSKTEYSSKFLDLVQGVLGLLNHKEISSMSLDEQRLLEMCIGVLTDMVEN